MTRRRSARIVLALLAISCLLLLLSAVGVLPKPVRGARRFQVNVDPTNGTAPSESDAEVAGTDGPPWTEPRVTEPSDVVMQPLPVVGNDPDLLPEHEGELRRWPEDLSVPHLCAPDLARYVGQAGSEQPLAGVTVILDPARGGPDHGAVWGSGADAVMEKTIVLDIAREAEKALMRMGASVIMTRTTDEAVSMFASAAKAADVSLVRYIDAAQSAGYATDTIEHLRMLMGDVIRINQNSPASGGRGLFGTIGTPPQLRMIYDIESQMTDTIFIHIALAYDGNDPSHRGSEAYYMSQSYVEDVNNGYAAGQNPLDLAPNYARIDSNGRMRLAQLLKSALATMEPELRPEDASVPGVEKDMAVLRLNGYVGASLMPGYLSNADDRAVLASAEGRQNIGRAIANAVLQYFAAP